MRLLGLSVFSLSFACARAAILEPSLDCASRSSEDDEACQEPLKAVTTVVPGSFYVAKLPCLDCPVMQWTGERDNRKPHLAQADNDLFFNISLIHENRTLVLNDEPIFPSLKTNPRPPRIRVDQIAPNFTRADLAERMECAQGALCPSGGCFCSSGEMSTVDVDFDYCSHWLESDPDTQTEQWEITFDAIGGSELFSEQPIWTFNNSQQNMLRIIVQGKEIEGERYAGEKDLQAASSLFGNLEESEARYRYEVVSVDLVKRSYTFPARDKLGFMGKFRLFFGLDIVRKDGHIIYFQEEWAQHGKQGSLREHIGVIIHDWPWDIVFIVLGTVAGSLFVVWASAKLFLVVKQQRELARWDGMDALWERMRLPRADEEEDRLLDGGYRDEPDEDRASRYTDEVDTNKPLPSKPLPEKPLPAVPLIDA